MKVLLHDYVRPVCDKCGSKSKMSRTVCANGTSLVYFACLNCNKRLGENIPHEFVRTYLRDLRTVHPSHPAIPDDIDGIPIFLDYRTEQTCPICGSIGDLEYHHWMPRKFARDARVEPNWREWDAAGTHLCRECHALWHELVAPLDRLANA